MASNKWTCSLTGRHRVQAVHGWQPRRTRNQTWHPHSSTHSSTRRKDVGHEPQINPEGARTADEEAKRHAIERASEDTAATALSLVLRSFIHLLGAHPISIPSFTVDSVHYCAILLPVRVAVTYCSKFPSVQSYCTRKVRVTVLDLHPSPFSPGRERSAHPVESHAVLPFLPRPSSPASLHSDRRSTTHSLWVATQSLTGGRSAHPQFGS